MGRNTGTNYHTMEEKTMKKGNWIIKGRGAKEIAVKTKAGTAKPINKNSVSYQTPNGVRIRVSEETLHH